MSVTDPNLRLLHKSDLQTLLEEAARDGARSALAAIGIDSPEKIEDLRVALDIGRGVREAKREAWRQVGKALLWALFVGVLVWLLGPKIGSKAASLFSGHWG